MSRSKFWLGWGVVFAYQVALDQLPVWYGKFSGGAQLVTLLITVLLLATIIASRVHDTGCSRAWMTAVFFPPLALPLGFMPSDPAAPKINTRFSIFVGVVVAAATAVIVWWIGTVAVSFALLNHGCSSGSTTACELLGNFKFIY